MKTRQQKHVVGHRSLRKKSDGNVVKVAAFKAKYGSQSYCEYTLYSPEAICSLRASLRLNQTDFWGPLGVKQSSGSMYETGVNELPIQVSMLIEVIYERGINLSSIANREKVEAVMKDYQS